MESVSFWLSQQISLEILSNFEVPLCRQRLLGCFHAALTPPQKKITQKQRLKGGSGPAWITKGQSFPKLESSGSQDGGKIEVGRVRGEPGLGHWRGGEMSELGKHLSAQPHGHGQGVMLE